MSTSRIHAHTRAHTRTYSLQFLHRNRARDPFHRYAFLPSLSLFTFLPLFSLFFIPQHPSPSYFLYSYDSLSPSILLSNLAIFPRSLLNPPLTHPQYKQVVLYGILAHTSTLLIVRKYIYASIMFTESHHWTSIPHRYALLYAHRCLKVNLERMYK